MFFLSLFFFANVSVLHSTKTHILKKRTTFDLETYPVKML